MQQKWDDLDKSIINSFFDIDTKENYNDKLLKKLREKNKKIAYNGRVRTVAASLICAGILLMFVYTTSLQYNLIDFQWRVKMQITSIEKSYDTNLIKNILGE